jgi:uncharacterized membrane protein
MTKFQLAMRWVLSTFMVLIGTAHFTHGPMFASIVPPFMPYRLALVYLSGAIEIGLGILLSIPRTQRFAAWSLVALFIAVYPANIYMALHPGLEIVGKPAWLPQPSEAAGFIRLPFQFALLYWAWLYTKVPKAAGAGESTTK